MGPLGNSSVLSEGCAASRRGKISAWEESWLAVGEWSAEGGQQWRSVGAMLLSTIWGDLERGQTAKWQSCSRGHHALNFHTRFLIPFWSYQLRSPLFVILLSLWIWDAPALGGFNIHSNCTTYAHLYVVWQFCLGSYGNWEHPVILLFSASRQLNLYLWHNGGSILSKGLLYGESKWLVKWKVPGLTKKLLKRHLLGRLTCI